jgi:hypothetical protein
VEALRFAPDDQTIAAIFSYSSSDKLWFTILTASDGSQRCTYKYQSATSSQAFPTGLLYTSSPDLIVAMTINSKWALISLPIAGGCLGSLTVPTANFIQGTT